MGFTVRYVILSEGEIWRQFRAGMHGLAAMMGMIGFPLVGLLSGALAGSKYDFARLTTPQSVVNVQYG